MCPFDFQFRHNSSLNLHFCGMWSSPQRKHGFFGFGPFGECGGFTKCIPPSAGEFLKLLACSSAISIARAIFTAVFHASSFFSAKCLFWMCLLLRPQTNRSLRASSKNVPKAQCSEHLFRAALYATTPSPSCCSRLWKCNRSAITISLGS